MTKKKDERIKQAQIEAVYALVASGKSVSSACIESGISKAMFLRDKDPDRYARAREDGAHAEFDEMADLERDCLSGEIDPQVYRAAMDTRKWRLSKKLPGVFGDKLGLEHSGTIDLAAAINEARKRVE